MTTLHDESAIGDIVQRAGDYLVQALETTIREALQAEIVKALDKALKDGKFYKYMSDELQSGVVDLLKEIKTFKEEAAGGNGGRNQDAQQKAENMLSEASTQLDYIFKSTEEAATKILDIVEKNMNTQEQVLALLEEEASKNPDNELINKLKSINQGIQNDYIEVMTALSFQDLTGQRIKKVLSFLSFVENEIFRILVSTGIKMKEKAASPDKDVEEIISEAQARVDDTLKGPQADTNQGDIDSLLADLGM
ncbi:MAG: protein phosphatase CheZ [Pseudomonadota bacterium]